ncbi:MAG: DUF4134 family protein [Chitinophagaceae bacterium]|nr:DUF4134 family protein [Chitinophagaceae bacterium]
MQKRKCLRLYKSRLINYFLTPTTLLFSIGAIAQSGSAGISAATNEVKSYFEVGTTLVYAIGAIIGLVGAVKV